MKNWLWMLLTCALLTASTVSCAEEVVYAVPPAHPAYGCVEIEDDYGVREVCGPYYYSGAELFYWDAHFGCWIGPHGYWMGGVWHRGWVAGYHTWYHRGLYHPHGWHGAHYYHGGGHGGYHGGGHGGGHGGHR